MYEIDKIIARYEAMAARLRTLVHPHVCVRSEMLRGRVCEEARTRLLMMAMMDRVTGRHVGIEGWDDDLCRQAWVDGVLGRGLPASQVSVGYVDG